MENEKITEIVIADGDYAEIYAPFRGSKEENDEKIKRGMLTRIGMKKEEIDRLIDSIEVVPDRGGADGMFDDEPYTPVKLVKKIYKVPPILTLSETEPEEQIKDSEREPRQTMLQQYYGDREAELRRRKTFDRFKSHVTKKTIDTYEENGTKRTIEVYTIEDYPSKSQDSDELLLDGYQTRLERLSRAHQKDFSPYDRELKRLKALSIREIMLKYEEMHELNPEEAEQFKKTAMETVSEFNSPEFKRNAIQALIDQDTEFIETNNYTYNSRQNTAENLKTLGKDGEKSVKAQISDEQTFAQKFGLKAMNAMIDIRNHTKVPVNKAVGTWIASPIYRALMGIKQAKSKEPVNVDGYLITPMEDMLATSQKHSRGMFKNKPSHRYHARKDYFIEEEKKRISQNISERKIYKGKETKVTLGSLIKLAVIPRIRAITEYKNGNAAILNAGLYDIEDATAERNLQMSQKRHRVINTMKRIASCEKEIEDLNFILKITKDPIEKEKIETIIKQRELLRGTLEGRLIEAERIEIDSVSTDAVSMSQHDKANKANMTTVVRGFKTAARIVVGTLMSKYLYHEVMKKEKMPDTFKWIPPEEIERKVTEKVTKTVPGMDKADIANITLKDIYKEGSGLLKYHAYGGKQVEDKTSYFRGIAFEFQGKLLSGSDGKGFDPTKLTNVRVDQAIEENTTLVSLVQEILQNKLGKQFTQDQVNDLITSGQISGFNVWRSTSETGIPTGWLDASKIVPDIINSGSHTITEEVTRKVVETIPGRYELISGDVYLRKVMELNPAVIAAEFGLVASEISDLNDALRFTRSQENIEMRSTRKLMRMAKENMELKVRKILEEKRKGKTKKSKKKFNIKGTSKSDIPPMEIKENIKSFQRTNKSKVRYYAHKSEAMNRATEIESKKRKGVTVFDRFVGSKKADLKSGYDENALGTNDRFEPTTLKEEGERE